MQNTPRKFGDVFVKKQAFLDNRNRDLRKPQNCLFAKGLVYDLGKKLKFFHLLCLSKIDREKVFADVLDRKEAFQDY